MATLIRLKRKKSSGNEGIVLAAGEAYYNTADKHLYIGNSDGEDVSSAKKHIAQITPIDAGETTIKFQLGEDENNIYSKELNIEMSKLEQPVKISLDGSITGNTEFDGSTDVTITTSFSWKDLPKDKIENE